MFVSLSLRLSYISHPPGCACSCEADQEVRPHPGDHDDEDGDERQPGRASRLGRDRGELGFRGLRLDEVVCGNVRARRFESDPRELQVG